MARRGTVLDLTGPTLKHMLEGMGSRLAMTDEELQALLMQSDGRFTVTQAELKKLTKEAGANGVSEAQLRAMMPLTMAAPAAKIDKDAPGKGRVKDDCPGLVYGRSDREICLPLGALSFADKAVSFTPGAKKSRPPFDYPGSALGEPDYKNTYSADFISLGCDGVLVTQFTDNILVDVEGVDLYIFEIGPVVERTELAISTDGTTWIDVGVIEGARSDVDIGPFVKKEKFPSSSQECQQGMWRNHSGGTLMPSLLSARKSGCRWTARFSSMSASSISSRKPNVLQDLAQQLEDYGSDIRVTVEGHTDSRVRQCQQDAFGKPREVRLDPPVETHIACAEGCDDCRLWRKPSGCGQFDEEEAARRTGASYPHPSRQEGLSEGVSR